MRRLAASLLLLLAASPAAAQTPDLAFEGSLVFYADDTEFSNEFRTGETALGTFGSAAVEAALNDRVLLRAGAFGHHRLGSHASFDQARPVLSVVIRGPRSRIVLGTLETMRRLDGAGPDRTSPHGLLPALQRETLAFERPFETGLQWIVQTPRVTQDAWIHWQRRNTRTEREVFDVGIVNAIRLRPEFALRHQLHIVHQGGQMGGAPAPVADSIAAAVGVEVGGPTGRLDRLALELMVAGSRHVPDRGQPERSLNGFATFLRASIEQAPWRLHTILWRADDFIKAEGDPLYLSERRDGTRYRGLRDYGEAGLTRTFALAPDAALEASLRVHRAEQAVDYSIRILAVTKVQWKRPGS